MRLRIVAVVLVAAILGGGALAARDLLTGGSGGGWSHETGEAWEAERSLIAGFDRGRPNLTLLVEAADGDVDSAEVSAAVDELATVLGERRDITQVESYWSLGRPDFLRSDDGGSALLLARIPGDTRYFADRVEAITPLLRQTSDAIEVGIGGEAALHHDIADAMRGLAVPMALTALVGLALVLLITRSVTVTLLWGVTSMLAVSGTLIGLGVVARFREVPMISMMLGIALAWGIASGGGFLIARRFLAEHAAGANPRQAVVATIGTAGRTVAIGAGVAAAGGFALWLMPTTLLRSSGYAFGIAGVVAGIAAVPVLGALLALTGNRLFGSRSGRAASVTPRSRLDPVSTVSRANPVITLMISTAVLGAVLFTGFQLSLGEPGPETLEEGASSRRVAQTIAAQYPADDAGAPFVVARGLVQFSQADEQAAAYGRELSTITGVVRVDTAAGSFAEGESTEVPPEVAELFASDDGLWYKAPVAGSPIGRIADEAVREIQATPRPFRVQVGGLAAREADTVGAIEARTIIFMLAALLIAVLLLSWLLRSVSAALRATLSIVLMSAAALAVVRWGFAEGLLAPVLGFVSGGSTEAVAPTLAWATGFAVGGMSLLLGWGAVREMNDATRGDAGSAALALASTRARHLEATVLIALPFAPFVVAEWRPAQVIGVAALATAVLAASVGRFIVVPALTSIAGNRLWPTDARGDQRRVYPTTPVALLAVEAARADDADADADAVDDSVEDPAVDDAPAERAPAAETPPVAATPPPAVVAVVAPPSAAEPSPAPAAADATAAPDGPPAEPFAAPDPAAADDPEAAPPGARSADQEASPVADREPASSSPGPAPEAVAEPEPVVDVEPVVEPVVEAGPGDEPVAAEAEPAPIEREDAAPAKAVAPDQSPTAVSEPETTPATTEPDSAEPDTVELDSGEPERTERRDPVPAAVAPVIEHGPEPADADSAPPEPIAPADKPRVPAGVGEPRDDAGPMVGAAQDVESDAPLLAVASTLSAVDLSDSLPGRRGSGDPSSAVDVVLLTESVIASLDPAIPFTTEIGSGWVANPSNNLSRVMEAILRDASSRGGDEVLVYGHASRGRYRWMVVDSGPQADDPDRARTLAEAQRFIRRVGGVVECRPQGDFTVFVVEIPMAS